jgi:phage FluMu protein Com
MPIEFPCPQCNQLLRTPDDTAGRKAKCPQCASVVDIPVAPQSEGAGFNPFAGKLEMAGGDSGNVEVDTNPYAAPQEAASRPDFGVAAPGDEELVPTRVTTGEILSRTWTRFTNNLVPCLLFGLIAIGIQMAAQVVGIPLQILQTAFQ